jgi:WD40 repeat protein/serine/threonine protein kinase
MSDDSSSGDTIHELADSFVARFRAGERPSVEEFAHRYPALADELRDLLPALVLLEQNVPPEERAGSDHAVASFGPPPEIEGYSILREIGRGGMGIVFEAVQSSLGRHVALKILSRQSLLNPTHLERFRLEARAAARLHHTHIVPVFGVGECKGLHYYAMQFIPGQSLDLVIDALRQMRHGDHSHDDGTIKDSYTRSVAKSLLAGNRFPTQGEVTPDGLAVESEPEVFETPMEPRNPVTPASLTDVQTGRQFYHSVARVGFQAAQALAYAHSEGILHRDVKPSNLILDANGDVWITDFGLARDESSDGLTHTGDIVGTLRYMAPERLEGWSDRRSDVYGLGATLYELLTQRPLLRAKSRGTLVDSVLHDIPPAPSKADPLVPRDLETIILKSISKEPAARYHTAAEMADDLQRFLGDRSILARRTSLMERLALWRRRNPVVAALSATVATLLVAAVAILAVSNARVLRESAAKDAALELARQNERRERGRFYAAQINLASQALRSEDYARTFQLLETLRPRAGDVDLRGFEWYHLYHLINSNVVKRWRAHDDVISQLVWAPDDTWFASGGADGVVRFWDARSGEKRGELAMEFMPRGLAVSADGRLLAVALINGEVALCDPTAPSELRRWMAHPVIAGTRAVAVSPDGSLIASGADASPASPDQLKLWNDKGQLLSSHPDHQSLIGALAFSPDGQTLASASFDWIAGKKLILWTIGDKLEKVSELNDFGAMTLGFSEDGKSIWAGGHPETSGRSLCRLDVEPLAVGESYVGHERHVYAALTAREREVVTASNDRTLRAWDPQTGESTVIGTEVMSVHAVAASPTRRLVVNGDGGGSITLRDLDALPATAELSHNLHPGGGDYVDSVAFSPDGGSLYVGYSPFNVVDADTLALSHVGPQGAIVAISPACDRVAAYDGGRIEIWDPAGKTRYSVLEVGEVQRAVFSPDGKYLTAWNPFAPPRTTKVWNTQSGEVAGQLPLHTSRVSRTVVTFSPDGLRMAAGAQFELVEVYDLQRGQTIDEELTFEKEQAVTACVYSSDGSMLAAGSTDGRLVLFDVDTESGDLTLRSRLGGHTLQIEALAFSPDGTELVSASRDGSVRLWDVALAQERITFDIDARLVAFSPDGNRLAVVTQDSKLRVLKASTLPAARAVARPITAPN